MSQSDTPEPLVKQARAFEIIALVATLLLTLGLLRLVHVLPLVSAMLDALRAGDWGMAMAQVVRTLRGLVEILPTLFYISGVWAAWGLFGRIGKGQLFSAANSKAIASIGTSLIAGSIAAMVVVPFVASFINGGRGMGVRVESETLALTVIGGALLVLGRMMAKAQSLAGENASLKAELSDFI